MAQYIDLNGVHMWYDDRGQGDPLVLLHGGLTDSRDFVGNLDALTGQFRVYLPERRGQAHGRRRGAIDPRADGPGHRRVSRDARPSGQPTHLVGYSAGASVALRVAVARPDLVHKLVLISGTFGNDGLLIRPSADAEPPPELVDAFASVSPDGADHLRVVITKVAQAAVEEPGLAVADLEAVGCQTLLMLGDDDLVSLEHNVLMYRSLPSAQLAVVPGASHLLLLEKPAFCTRLVEEFLTVGPKPTMLPIRRASPHEP
ncbi:MAG: alpha/beta hydrolase [Chloroflexi bacterium]|nr:alpha/beta hydrolase [Chloroflexota bacterium]